MARCNYEENRKSLSDRTADRWWPERRGRGRGYPTGSVPMQRGGRRAWGVFYFLFVERERSERERE